jgi:hypothetical protein
VFTKKRKTLKKWDDFLVEVEEQDADAKSRAMDSAEREITDIVNKVTKAAAGDEGMAREMLQSIIVGLQNHLKTVR